MSFFQHDDVVPGEEQQINGEDLFSESLIRFPVALEKALDLKSERIKETGADEQADGKNLG